MAPIERSSQPSNFPSSHTEPTKTPAASMEAKTLDGKLLHLGAAQDLLGKTSTPGSVVPVDPTPFVAALQQPVQRSRSASVSSKASDSLPSSRGDLKPREHNGIAQKNYLNSLPGELIHTIMRDVIPTGSGPLDFLNKPLTMLSVSHLFHNFVANDTRIWGDSAAKQAESKSITLQQAWMAQFKELPKETQKAIIVTQTKIDVFSEKDVAQFNSAVKPIMEALEVAETAQKVGSMVYSLPNVLRAAKESRICAPDLLFPTINALYEKFIDRYFNNEDDVPTTGAFKKYWDVVVVIANDVSVPVLILSTEEIKDKLEERMNRSFERAKKSESENEMQFYLEEVNLLAERVGKTAPVLSSEEAKAKYKEFMNRAVDLAKITEIKYFKKVFLDDVKRFAVLAEEAPPVV